MFRYIGLAMILFLHSFHQITLAQLRMEIPVGKPGTIKLSRKVISIQGRGSVDVQSGTFLVPESRKRPSRNVVEIPFYRLKSTSENPASPIFLLAGGPGSSWINRFQNKENFEEVQFYRTIADVILFDQRGAGNAKPKMQSHQRSQIPLLKPLTPEAIGLRLRQMSEKCRARLEGEGIDLAAYNTQENATDVNDLRIALGYKRFSLVGGSYGSHLALTIMRQFPETVDRVVVYGIEGHDHTWDDPAGYLATLGRIAKEIEASDEFGSRIPKCGLLGAMRTVIDRLEAKPEKVSIEHNGNKMTVLVDAFLIRQIVGFQAGRKSQMNAWPELILDLYEGNYSQVAVGAVSYRSIRLDRPIHYLMDCASGITKERRKRYKNSANQQLLGDINHEYECLGDVWKVPDLGDSFRSNFESKIPTLIVHGTWDTSTPIENARELAAMLENSQLVEVVTGNHGAIYNLYTHWEPAYRKIGAFLKGKEVSFPAKIRLPKVKFRPRTVRGAHGR